MVTVGDVLLEARDTLSDPNKTRWTDARLIRALNEGVKEFVIQTNILQHKVFVTVEKGIAQYDLSSTFLSISRVQLRETNLEFKSHREMDRKTTLWQADEGPVQFVVFDNLLPAVFRLYPIPGDGTIQYITSNQNYGIITDIDVIQDIFELPGIEDLEDIQDYLVVYGIKRPAVVDSIDDEFPLNELWKSIIIRYIVSRALRDDLDAINRTAGNEEYNIYLKMVQATREKQMSNFTTSELAIPYKGFQ